MLNEKIRNLRKQNNFTQEELAGKLNVSRQAVTKWESGAGTPDIINLEALAGLFGLTIDELLSGEQPDGRENVSRTEYDVFGSDDFEIAFGTVNTLDVTLCDAEKVVVEIRTDLPDKAYHLAKVKLENGRRKDFAVVQIQLDKKYISIVSGKTLSRQDLKKHLFVKVLLPAEFCRRIELQGEAESLVIHDFSEPRTVEFTGKADNVTASNVKGHIDLTSNSDMELHYDGSAEQFDINQLNAMSILYLPAGAPVNVYNEGRRCGLVFDGYESSPEAGSKVELNGFKSELTVRSE